MVRASVTPLRLTWALVLAGCAARLVGLGGPSLWFDEAATVYLATAPDFTAAMATDRHPPLTPLFYRAWIPFAGMSEAALRLLPALVSCAALGLFALLARRVLDERRAAFAVCLCALSPFLVWNAQEARMYSFLELGSVLALLSACAVSERRFALPLFGIVAGIALAFGSHYMGVLSACAAVGVLAVRVQLGRLSFKRGAQTVLALAAGGLVWLPWVWHVLPRQLSTSWAHQARMALRDFVELPVRFVVHEARFLEGAAEALILATAACLLALFAAAAWTAARRRDPGARLALAAFGAPLAGALALTLVFPANFIPRYLVAAAPGALLAMGAGWGALPLRSVRYAASAVVALGCLSLLADHKLHGRREDYRGACARVVDEWREGDHVLALSGTPEPFSQAPVRYYLRSEPAVLASLLTAPDFVEHERPLLEAGTRLHVVHRRGEWAAEEGLDVLLARYKLLDRSPERVRISYVLLEVPERTVERVGWRR